MRASRGHENGAWLSDTIIYGLGTECYLQRGGKENGYFQHKTQAQGSSGEITAKPVDMLNLSFNFKCIFMRSKFWLPWAGLAL